MLAPPAPRRPAAGTATPTPWLGAAIAARAAADPHHTAVADPAGPVTYADLDRRSDRLAAALVEAGAGPEVCVGLLLERSAEFVTAALAVLKAGAAYLPLDPKTPPDRADYILTDAAAPLLLTHRGLARPLRPGPWRVLDLDGPEAAHLHTRHAEFSAVTPAADDLAYVIYTSGSTGRPKGVEITHGNLANLVAWHRAAFGVTAADRASQVAGLGFDAAVWEVWPALAAGASLHIADEVTRRSPQALRDWLVAHRITVAFVPTVLAAQMLHTPWPADTALRTMLTGADTLRRGPAAGLPFTLVNNYGPTECTVVATSGVVPPAADGVPSIGRPIANTTAFVLDDALRPVADGEPGELCLAGALVGRGYRNNPALTADKFVTLTPPGGTPVRVYRTGDRVRRLPGGEFAFLGRDDEQVKVRGYRVELGEIAAGLDRCPGVEASVVTAPDTGDGPALVGYVVPRDPGLTAADLRAFLAPRLPDYMIPAQFVAVRALPLTANGKLDRAALPPPIPENLLPERPAGSTPAGPADGVRGQVAALVGSLLGIADVDPEGNIFLMGGHSMFGVQLLARIADKFGVKLTLRQLFTQPTVAAIAAEVVRRKGG